MWTSNRLVGSIAVVTCDDFEDSDNLLVVEKGSVTKIRTMEADPFSQPIHGSPKSFDTSA